jgi:hypothetical protein
MPSTGLLSLIQPSERFLRSADLARDYHDPRALEGYFLTPFTRSCLERISEGFEPQSSRRAWRLTGQYGTGKSSFGLLLASALRDVSHRLPKSLSKEVAEVIPSLRRSSYLPVLVVGSREPMALAILRSLGSALSETSGKGRKSDLEQEIARLVSKAEPVAENRLVAIIEETSSKIVDSGKAQGIVIILDEVGKFLEYAALHPDRQDIYLLQRLAESAQRSGKNPILLICFLHQGFNAYASDLSVTSQREWEKIAGRLEEIVFEQPLDQIAAVVASALNTQANKLPAPLRQQAITSMEQATALGWYGTAAGKKSLRDQAPGLFPIDPMVLPVLLRTFQRFGQNERSLFGFLLSHEPFGLRTFCANTPLDQARPYRLHDFYDYVRFNFGHRLATASYRSRWSVIETTIERWHSPEPLDHIVLKTIGILNVLQSDDVAPTEEAIQWAVAGTNAAGRTQVAAVLKNLRKRQVIHYRTHARSYCLWDYSSVDIEARFEEAKRQIKEIPSVSSTILDKLDTRPLVARRHYIKTGNLRYFQVVYCPSAELADHLTEDTQLSDDHQADGTILVPLCEHEREHQQARELALSCKKDSRCLRLIAVPQPLQKLTGVVLESLRWDWVMAHTLELNHDEFARDEVSRYQEHAENALQKAIQDYIGLNRLAGRSSLTWFYAGKELPVRTGRELLTRLSDLCDVIYDRAPHIQNELINRHNLSSAAAAARMRLVELMFAQADKPLLGFSEDKNPPEKSMYLSVLQQAQLHRHVKKSWQITDPPEDDPCRLRPALQRIRQIIQDKPDTRIPIDHLLRELRQAPYGLRDGLFPLLLAVIAITDEQEVAFYKTGTFLTELHQEAFLQLTKNPQDFEIQYCKIQGIRTELFTRLSHILELKPEGESRVELLDITRKLCQFIAQLPEYTRTTKRLPRAAQAVREAILAAQEPVKLIFHDLPAACGFEAFTTAERSSGKVAQQFVGTLKTALDELKTAFEQLQERQRKAIAKEFGYEGQEFLRTRRDIAARAESLLLQVTEPKLKAFCFRVMDENLPENDWLESVGSLLALRPPQRWKDEEEETFHRELAATVGRFLRSESVAFRTSKGDKSGRGLRIAVTQADGQEKQEVIHFSKDEEAQLGLLEKDLLKLIGKNKRLGLAAASRAIWSQLKDTPES